MSDPKVEERARELLEPHEFRVTQRRQDFGGIPVTSSAVDYWKAVHVVADLLTKLDEAEMRLTISRGASDGYSERLTRVHEQMTLNENRLRALIAGVELALADPHGLEAHRAILSRLLPSTPTEEGKSDE